LVIVEEDQLSLAIGKEGQNVRLASKLTGWQIELVSSRELEQRERLQEHLLMPIEDMVGVTEKMAERLKAEGIHSVQKLMKTPVDEILAIPGIGEKTVEKLLATGEKTVKELDIALEELIRKENEERELAKKEEKPLFDESVMEDEKPAEEPEEKEAEAPLTEEELFKDSVGDEESSEEPVVDEEGEEQPVVDANNAEGAASGEKTEGAS
jgi:N utilization substance protein A